MPGGGRGVHFLWRLRGGGSYLLQLLGAPECQIPSCLLFFFNFFFNVYLLLRDRETQNLKQVPGSSCQHRAQHGARTHEP